jgi:hypothetical protein
MRTHTLTEREVNELRDRLGRMSGEGPTSFNRVYDKDSKFMKRATLEFPCGEIAKDSMQTLALTGGRPPRTGPITKNDRFNAQGLEGKCSVDMTLLDAVLRYDMLPPHRRHIVASSK